MIYPSTIYKYRDWTNPFHQEILKSKIIYLPSPKDLNDPFDCRPPISLEMLDSDEKIKAYVENYIKDSPSINQNRNVDVKTIKTKMFDFIKYRKSDYIKEYNKAYIEKGNQHFGIFCASTIWNSIQMWSYYSNYHTGFCIGLITEELIKFIPGFRSMKTIYRKEYPKVNPLAPYEKESPSQEFIDSCFERSHIKASGWKHEKEYRIFSNIFPMQFYDESRQIKINRDSFRSLFIGLQFPEKDLSTMIDYAKDLKVPLFKAVQVPYKFKLSKVRII